MFYILISIYLYILLSLIFIIYNPLSSPYFIIIIFYHPRFFFFSFLSFIIFKFIQIIFFFIILIAIILLIIILILLIFIMHQHQTKCVTRTGRGNRTPDLFAWRFLHSPGTEQCPAHQAGKTPINIPKIPNAQKSTKKCPNKKQIKSVQHKIHWPRISRKLKGFCPKKA